MDRAHLRPSGGVFGGVLSNNNNNNVKSNSETSSSDNSNGILFSRQLSVRICDSTISTENSLTLSVELVSRFNELRRELSLKVLDPNDPFFIYHYLIDNCEFERLKQQQKLLISFETFPTKLVALFDRCEDDNGSFIISIRNLNRNSLQLEIIERNEFRHFVHLDFTIPAASEEYVRSNFCVNFRKVQSENEELLKNIASLEMELSSLTLSKSKDLQSVQRNFQQEKQHLEQKLVDVQRLYRDDKERYSENEKVYKSKLSKLQLESSTKDTIIEKLEREAKESESDLKDRFKSEMLRKNHKIGELEEKNKELEEDARYQKELREVTGQQLKAIKAEFETVRKDLGKANEIIRKLQSEVKVSREKVGVLNRVAHKQEDQIEHKDSTVGKLAQDMKICLQQIDTKNEHIAQLEDQIDRLKAKYSQTDLQLMANKKVISTLTKELEQQIKLNARSRESPIPQTKDSQTQHIVDEPIVETRRKTILKSPTKPSRHHHEPVRQSTTTIPKKVPEDSRGSVNLKPVNLRANLRTKNVNTRNVLSFI